MTHQHAIEVKIAEANNNKKTKALLAELGGVCVCGCMCAGLIPREKINHDSSVACLTTNHQRIAH